MATVNSGTMVLVILTSSHVVSMMIGRISGIIWIGSDSNFS